MYIHVYTYVPYVCVYYMCMLYSTIKFMLHVSIMYTISVLYQVVWLAGLKFDRVTAETDIQNFSVILKKFNCHLHGKCLTSSALFIDNPTLTFQSLLIFYL